MLWIAFISLGLLAGSLSGLIGIGGGVVVIPALVFLFGFSQRMAQGTTLLLIPAALVTALIYWKHGQTNVHAAGLMIIGFVIGALIATHFAFRVPEATITKIFGVFLLLVAVKMLLSGKV
jgi:uncharacterized membrane protein YfcA